jgi:hypothetical protein
MSIGFPDAGSPSIDRTSFEKLFKVVNKENINPVNYGSEVSKQLTPEEIKNLHFFRFAYRNGIGVAELRRMRFVKALYTMGKIEG